MSKRFVRKACCLVLALGLTIPATAQDSASPAGNVLLTVTGVLSVTNTNDALALDREMLMALPMTTFSTSTIWTEGEHSFTGVSLADFANAVGVDSGHFLARAINDYTVEIPISDAVENGPIVAYLMDGAAIPVRDKGPLWVIYPYDINADYRSEVIYTRSIWQLDRLEIVP